MKEEISSNSSIKEIVSEIREEEKSPIKFPKEIWRDSARESEQDKRFEVERAAYLNNFKSLIENLDNDSNKEILNQYKLEVKEYEKFR